MADKVYEANTDLVLNIANRAAYNRRIRETTEEIQHKAAVETEQRKERSFVLEIVSMLLVVAASIALCGVTFICLWEHLWLTALMSAACFLLSLWMAKANLEMIADG